MQFIVNLIVFSLFSGSLALIVLTLWANAPRILAALAGQGVTPVTIVPPLKIAIPRRLKLIEGERNARTREARRVLMVPDLAYAADARLLPDLPRAA